MKTYPIKPIMTDEELRNLVASTARATAANTAGLAETRQLIDANANSTAEGLAESRRLLDEGLAESRRALDEGLAKTRQLINSNARATEANSESISKLGEKVDQIDDAVVGLFERLDERLNRLANEFDHRMGQLIDIQMANVSEHADFMARSREHDQQIQVLIEENRSDRAAAAARAKESDRKHLAATELIQQMFGEVQDINRRLAG